VLRRDAVGTFESRLRWSHRWKWLAPSIFLGAVALALIAYLARGAYSTDHGAAQARERALALALADDVKSLEQAREELAGVTGGPQLGAARADRALVELLLAGALSEPEPRGARKDQARTLVASASVTLDELARANPSPPEVARARAVGAALAPNRAELRRLATAAKGALPDDPQATLAELGVDIRSTDHAVRDRAVSDLGLLVARRPELLRGWYLLARGQALAGRRNEALATLDDLLKRNPRHEGALGLKEAITRPPSTAPIAPPVVAGATPPPVAAQAAQEPSAPPRGEKPVALPRKPDATAGEVSPTPSEAPATATHAAGHPEPAVPAAAGASPAPPAGDASPSDGEPPPAPRLKPAAVPEPEVVGGGG
jgi:hypothetical protein